MGGGGAGEVEAARLERNEDGVMLAPASSMTADVTNGPHHYLPGLNYQISTWFGKYFLLSARDHFPFR